MYSFDNEPHFHVDVNSGFGIYIYRFIPGTGYILATQLTGIGPAIIPDKIKELCKIYGEMPYKVENH